MKEISLIIPCYNDEKVVPKTFSAVKKVLDKIGKQYEIIFVDDGSKDKTLEVIKSFEKKDKTVHVLEHKKNKGRGQAVQTGVAKAGGRYAGFIDSDLDINPKYLSGLYKLLSSGNDMAIGRRVHVLELPTLHRVFLSKGYHSLVRLMLGIKFDTECGIKMFNRKKILPVLRQTKNKRWFWSTEIVTLAHYSGLRIAELDVLRETNEETESSVDLLSDIKEYASELFRFRKELRQKGVI